jgi:hypothetical protein
MAHICFDDPQRDTIREELRKTYLEPVQNYNGGISLWQVGCVCPSLRLTSSMIVEAIQQLPTRLNSGLGRGSKVERHRGSVNSLQCARNMQHESGQ